MRTQTSVVFCPGAAFGPTGSDSRSCFLLKSGVKKKMLKSIVSIASRLLIAISLITATKSARADVTVGNFSDIQYWVGSGSKEAALVIDWNDGTATDNYTWGYRWDGSSTGEDMIRAVDLADIQLTIGLQFFTGLGYSFSNGTYDADGNGSIDHSATDVTFAGYWSYWTQDTTSPFASSSWVSSQVGMTGRTLVNGSWDGWSWASAPTYEEPDNNGPDAGVAVIPEPQAWILLAGALCVVGLVRRKFHKLA